MEGGKGRGGYDKERVARSGVNDFLTDVGRPLIEEGTPRERVNCCDARLPTM